MPGIEGTDLKLVTRIALVALFVGACGAAPFEGMGSRSSEWMGEPRVATTTTVPSVAPEVVSSRGLLWSNDAIVSVSLTDPQAVIAEVFARREGDRFIQASRAEISAVLPGVSFPAMVPRGAEWVSSQLVIDNSGLLSEDPAAAFGIWSAEPYTRSRSVAQMAVLRVYVDPVNSAEVELPDAEMSCARFALRTTEQCAIVSEGERDLWRLISSSGTTIVWFDEPYRYELFGRTFVSVSVLEKVAANVMPLADLVPQAP